MNFAEADAIAKTVLYEGYVLYPYRPSAIKNRQRWTFGGVYPHDDEGVQPSALHSECLLEGGGDTQIEIRIRFLHLTARQVFAADAPVTGTPDTATAWRKVDTLDAGGVTHTTWDEAIEREICVRPATIAELAGRDTVQAFEFHANDATQLLRDADGTVRGCIVRTQEALAGRLTAAVTALGDGVYRLCVQVDNDTPAGAATSAGAAQARALLSTHVLVGVERGMFVSLIDPPEFLADAARACVNRGAWPVLVGPEGARDTLLCSPIILYDWPQIADASPGDLFDGTEIDEILTLRILALTDAEKREMAATDERARALLARTEALTEEQMLRMHGVMSDPRDKLASPLRVGDQVRLKPRRGGDIFDLVLAGQTAVIEAIEVDFDNRVHVAVTVDADPGREFGLERMPGHRFFFAPDEVDVLRPAEAAP